MQGPLRSCQSLVFAWAHHEHQWGPPRPSYQTSCFEFEFLSPSLAHLLVHSLPALLIVSGSTGQYNLPTLDKATSMASTCVTKILQVSIIDPQALRSSLAFFRRLRVRMIMWSGILLNEILGLGLEIEWSDLQRSNEVHVPRTLGTKRTIARAQTTSPFGRPMKF